MPCVERVDLGAGGLIGLPVAGQDALLRVGQIGQYAEIQIILAVQIVKSFERVEDARVALRAEQQGGDGDERFRVVRDLFQLEPRGRTGIRQQRKDKIRQRVGGFRERQKEQQRDRTGQHPCAGQQQRKNRP